MSTNTGTKRKMRSKTAIAMVLAMVLSLFGGISLLPTTAYAATNVEKANVICAQYPYMDAGCDFNSQPTEIINISLSDAQAFGNAVSCPTTYWVIVYAKDGDNIKWTSNGKTGEQTSTPVGSKIGAYYNLWAGDVFSLNNSNVDPNKDVTFYISKGLKSYSVTVAEDITNGTVTADKASAAENDTVTLTVTPAENYEIDSVSYNDGSDHVITPVESVYSFSMPASNVTVTATFKAATPATYTVTFDANGHGTAPSNQTITSGSKASTPTEPTDDGWTFGGWYKEADCTNEWDFDTDTVTADTTLYAKWIENANNTETLLTTITPTGKSTYSETTTEVATVTQDCYTYNSQYGWLWFESGSVTVAANEGYTITKCVFIQNAKTPITISTSPYAIHFERGGVTENSSSGMDGVTSIEVYGYATTTATTYSVTVADSIANGTVTADKTTAAEGDTVTLTVTPAENYEIDSVSYNDGSDHVITPVESVYSFSMPAADVTVNATFTATYSVTFNSKGGSDVTSASVAEGNKVSKPTNPTRDGYTFLGWSKEETSSTYYDFDTAVTSSFTLYAQWEKKVETGVSDTSDISAEVKGLDDAIDTSDLTANQYVTSEIKVKNEAVTDVSNTVSNKVSEIKGTDSSITVNYLTIDISKIITTVASNGSTTDGTKTAVTELTKPIEVVIPNIDGDKVDIVREHAGTATQFTERSSRNTVATSFADGEYYYDKANKKVYIYSSKFSTYAILIKPANNTGGNTGGNPGGNTGGNTGGGTGGGGYSGPTYYTVTFNSNGGSNVSSQSVVSGGKVTKPADPTKSGYKFDGWYTDSTLKTAFDFSTSIYSSRTLYAKWTETTTPTPTTAPTVAPTEEPTANPTDGPTAKPTVKPTSSSTANPTEEPTANPTDEPTAKPTVKPTSSPTANPTVSPTATAKPALALNAGLKVSQTGKKITVKFGKVAGATSYEVYVAYCGQKFPTKATATTKKNSVSITKLNGKKLNLKKNFKVVVVAKKSKAKLGKTITAHVVGRKNVKYTNAKSIKITSKTALTLKKGKKSQIKAKTILVDSKKKQLTDAHAKEFRYASSNKKVATVSKTGKITAKGKGTATIYVYSRNGYAKKVKVTVK